MSNSYYIPHSDIYLQFKELDKTSLRSVVHYYEKNKEILEHLEDKQYFEVLATYANALFELGYYLKYIKVAEEVLYLSMDFNIYEFEGEDVYCSTLFKKAAGHYNLQQKEEAESILRQMIRMYPDNKYVVNFYKKVLSREKSISRKSRGLSVGLILAAALIIAIELLVIRPFHAEWTSYFEYSRFSALGAGIGVYIAGELLGLLTIEWRVRRELKCIKEDRKSCHK